MGMKRKKWTEEEERTLLSECSALLSSGALSRLRTREKKFQPVADRVNAAHHLRDPSAFPFRWSWRDVSVKVQNMRHQYLGVKLKLLRRPSDQIQDHALLLWPNFLRYQSVFGDIPLNPDARAHAADDHADDFDDDDEEEEAPVDDQLPRPASDGDGGGGRRRRFGALAAGIADLGEAALLREERRREREAAREEDDAARDLQRQEREHRREAERRRSAEEEEERARRRRRREERMEEEEMEWRERILVAQVEHERMAVQMHVDACQAQMHVLGMLVRLICQFLGGGAGGGDGGLGGLAHQVMHNLQQQQEQESPESLVGDEVKNDVHSAGHYL